MTGVIHQSTISKILELQWQNMLESPIRSIKASHIMQNSIYIWQNMKLFSILYIAIKISQSFSIPDAQPDPFREFFRPDSLSYSQSHSLEIPDSQSPEISDSQSLEIPDSQNSESTTLTTSRDERIA